jgi:hypothetical protein
MKLQATIVISYRADSFGDAGGALDDVLQRARERDDVEIDSIQLATPASAGPVSLPYVERPRPAAESAAPAARRRAQLTAAPTQDDGEEHRSPAPKLPSPARVLGLEGAFSCLCTTVQPR